MPCTADALPAGSGMSLWAVALLHRHVSSAGQPPTVAAWVQAANLGVERTLHTPKCAQSVLLHHRALHVAKVRVLHVGPVCG